MTQCSLEKMSDLQKLVSVFDSVCKRRKLKINVNKSKVMVCKWSRSEVVDLVWPHRVGLRGKSSFLFLVSRFNALNREYAFPLLRVYK